MKQVITSLIAAFIFLSATCNKAMQVTDPNLKKIFGKWQWVESSGGFAGKIVTPQKAGYSLRLQFSTDGIYLKYKNDSLVDRKKFSLSRQKSIHNNNEAWVVSFTDDTPVFNESPLPMSVSFEGSDTLILNEEVYDGFQYKYLRIK